MSERKSFICVASLGAIIQVIFCMIKVVGGVNSMRWEINVFIKPLGMLTARERERDWYVSVCKIGLQELRL